jgi:hypothetical protein
MKVEIEIPDPPEGWVYDCVRVALQDEMYCRDGKWWVVSGRKTSRRYPAAIKVEWTPSPELVAVLYPGWIAMDEGGSFWLHHNKPVACVHDWNCVGKMESLSDSIKPELLPPKNIPWDKCCFRIGGDE